MFTTRKARRIYLDMDDVLVDFMCSAMRHMGLTDYTIADYEHDIGRDIYTAYARKTGILYPANVWWEHFKREFWANMQPMECCSDLINLCADAVGRDNVALMTSPTKCGDCLAGKLDWIHRTLPSWLHRQYIMTPRKHLCATPDSLLIDDAEENIEPFHQAGGQAIAFPRPWNRHREFTLNPFPVVKRLLEFYQ